MFLLVYLYSQAFRLACITKMILGYVEVTTKRVRWTPQSWNIYRPKVLRLTTQSLFSGISSGIAVTGQRMIML